MDWLKLCILLAAVASVQIEAESPKKKIRIHLPQAVKHIHHHKKIYITNHPALSQYAPAFMPNAEGAVAVPTSIALPAVAKLMPISSVDVIDEPVRLPGLAGSASKLLPLYRARGYYGPTHSDLDDHDFNFAPPTAPADTYPLVVPSSVVTPSKNVHLTKKVKVVKVHEPPVKKIISKPKQKRVPARKPATIQHDNEHPVSAFHEQFYSDVQGGGTIRKIKKPPRVEKIVDGNTEHIHTYSEEHIHKVVFDDDQKYPGVMGVEPVAAAYAPLIPLKSNQLLTMASNPYRTMTVAGSIGGSPHYEYASYNPREVTHDHIFHDHGELPEEIDFTRDMFSQPPKVSYNSQGVRIGVGQAKRIKNKYPQRPAKVPPVDYSYYESIYSPNRIKTGKPTGHASLFVPSHDESLSEFKPVSTYSFKEGSNSKSRNKVPTYYGKPVTSYRPKSQPPYTVSSKIVHDYNPQHTYQASATGSGLSIFDDTNQFTNFKDSYVNNFEYDNYASSSNIHRSEDKRQKRINDRQRKGKSPVSTQNIRYGANGVMNFGENYVNDAVSFDDNDGAPSALENVESFDQLQFAGATSSTVYEAKDSESPYQYYAEIAVKTLGDQMTEPDASNVSFQYAEAPTITTTPIPNTIATTLPPNDFQTIQITADVTSPAPQLKEPKESKSYAESDVTDYKPKFIPQERHRVVKGMQSSENMYKQRYQLGKKHELTDVRPSVERSKLRYGDKI